MSSSILLNISSGSSNKEEIVTYSTDTLVVKTVEFNDMQYFYGMSKDKSFLNNLTGETFGRYIDLLFIALNNRTKELNYSRLYCDLLEGLITEEDFDEEIESNEDRYVMIGDIIPSDEDMCLLLNAASRLDDIVNSEDLATLFSFDSDSVDKKLLEIL